MKEEFGKNLRKHLEETKISVQKLSQMSGIPEQTIKSMIYSTQKTKQTKKPHRGTIAAICKALSVSDFYLLYGIKAFNLNKFNNYLRANNTSLEDLAIEGVCLNPQLVCRGMMPNLAEQEAIVKYVGVNGEDLFDAHVFTTGFLRAYQISRDRSKMQQRTADPADINEIYERLSSKHKDIVYSLAYDLYKIQIGEILDKK